MLGSAVQNVIALSDSVFLYHTTDLDFQAIGIVGIFYLIISAIGFGFSRGGQILIARYLGSGKMLAIKRTFYTLALFELILAVIIFVTLQGFSYEILDIFIDDTRLIEKGVQYLEPRSYGIFFSYLGVSIIALYTGISKPLFIIVDTLLLAVVNIVLNYGLIFGNLGLPEMGIAGAGLASAIAEMIAFFIFVVYMIFERNPVVSKIFKLPKLRWYLFNDVFNVASIIVVQTLVGLVSSFVFFSLIESLGGEALSISNLIRIVYLCLSIPTWGFASGMNTIASKIIGNEHQEDLIPATNKVALLNLCCTVLIALPLMFFSETLLYPLFGREDMSILIGAKPLFFILFLIMVVFSLSSIYFDSLIGIGATVWGLWVKLITSVLYLVLARWIILDTNAGLDIIWGIEILYWGVILIICLYIFKTGRWKRLISHHR